MWLVIVAGNLICLLSAYNFRLADLDYRFAALAFIALIVSPRVIVPIPRFNSVISISDTFIFLTLLLYGAETAVLLAATEALVSTLRFSRKPLTLGFNWACAACSTFLSARLLRLGFGDIVALSRTQLSAVFIVAMCVMALAQYAANSGMVAIAGALKRNQPIWATWKTHYLWTSITYFAGASAAAVIARLMGEAGFYAIAGTAPIVAIVYFTYRTYLKNVESSAAQAEQAQRHVEELSHYIAEQERIREQFSQIEKLSALGELASGVAHDFNNTLTGILGRAQLLLRTNDPERIRRGLNLIIKTAEDGAKTVKRIQDFARQRRDHDFELVAIDQILLDVSEMTRPLWKDQAEARNIQIALDLRIDSSATVMGNQSELREVLINMVFNAVDAMPEGGRLTLGAADAADSVVISVSDSGIGMSPEVCSRIFDPFFTTKGSGIGLGLAVSFGIIRRHGGTVEVESRPDQGTILRITLPAVKMADHVLEATSARETPKLVEPGNQFAEDRQTRILIVDDEQYVRALLRDMLEGEGCEIHLAAGGREALALIEELEFDGIFTDVGMPEMNGWELAHAIRQRDQEIPIAVITGWGESVGSNEQREAGVNWVVSKPFNMDRIVELVAEVKTKRRPSAQRPSIAAVAA